MQTPRDHWRAAFALLALAAAWLAAATSPAAAAFGSLAYDGCVGNSYTQGCDAVARAPFEGAYGVAVSPNGRSVYVASYRSNSVSHLFRGTGDGRLALDGCLNDDGSNLCGDLPQTPLSYAAGVAVSPDGRSVYVISGASDGTIAHFFRDDPGGQLYYDGCLAIDPDDGCADLPGLSMEAPRAVKVSPDGKSVYVASYGGSVAHFARNGPDGQIVFDGCWANDSGSDCVDVPGEPLTGATDVAVSPDGRAVYVTSGLKDSISTLSRDLDPGTLGRLTWDGCLNNNGTEDCGSLPGSPLDGAQGVVVSPDGRSVVVTSSGSDSVSHLRRDPADNELTWDSCLAASDGLGCTDLPGTPLDGALNVAMSPDGRSVYVAVIIGDAVAHVLRDPATGALAYDGCLSNDGSGGCSDLPDDPLDGAAGIAVSPDGRSVYVTSTESGTISHFVRDLTTPAPPPPPPPPAPVPAADTLAPSVSGLALAKRRLRFTLSEPATVTIAIQRCRTPSRRLASRPRCTRWTRAATPLTRGGAAGSNRLALRRLRPGAYRARVTAVDGAGNRSATATLRFRIARG